MPQPFSTKLRLLGESSLHIVMMSWINLADHTLPHAPSLELNRAPPHLVDASKHLPFSTNKRMESLENV
jgi:hypothetical protein